MIKGNWGQLMAKIPINPPFLKGETGGFIKGIMEGNPGQLRDVAVRFIAQISGIETLVS